MKQGKKLPKYIPGDIEKKWQDTWERNGLYAYKNESGKEPYYTLVELPYPSGDLHLGHWFAFVPPDAHARFNRMNGKNTFFPNGFDAFGLPAENAAIKRDIHPQDWTLKNIETMKSQFSTMGTMIDWSHEAITCLPEYYKWNQWIFIKMFERGIAYRGKVLSNWCPVDQTVLANEHVEDGKCWRCGTVVEQKEVEQWFLKITEYADELLWDYVDKKQSNGVDWPRSVREGQNNWIGRSEGAEVEFKIKDSESVISVFTTRPDTLYGATFLVVAPEHEILSLTSSSEVKAYVAKAGKKTELERKEQKEKTGVFTGLYAIHPLTGDEIPVWVADYVLKAYGTGAIMAVPAHDERDFEFASAFGLEVKQVIDPGKDVELPYVGPGTLINSSEWNGWQVPDSIAKVVESVESARIGNKKIIYHLHDWSVSRQRYWGTPVPMIHCEDCGIVPVPEKDLPVTLPYEVDYTPKGKPPLASAEEWMKVACPKCGKDARRDAETLDTFFDSSWYYYRYLDPKFDKGPFDSHLASEIMPVDIYFGGAEHTLGHTLYARFFTKFFKDLGLIAFDEFASKRVQHGVILGPDGHRMSKSRGNVVNPDDVVSEYGADTVRVYLSFMMPYEDTVAPWNPKAIAGIYRFLRRIWDLYEKVDSSTSSDIDKESRHLMHKTIKKVGEDLANIKFNTAIASMMEWLNFVSAKEKVSLEEYKTMLLLLAPFAPHISEELWQNLNGTDSSSIHLEVWPKYNEKELASETVTIAVQVNGKLRGSFEISHESIDDQAQVEVQGKEIDNVAKNLNSKTIHKVIYIKGKILNFVVS